MLALELPDGNGFRTPAEEADVASLIHSHVQIVLGGGHGRRVNRAQGLAVQVECCIAGDGVSGTASEKGAGIIRAVKFE